MPIVITTRQLLDRWMDIMWCSKHRHLLRDKCSQCGRLSDHHAFPIEMGENLLGCLLLHLEGGSHLAKPFDPHHTGVQLVRTRSSCWPPHGSSKSARLMPNSTTSSSWCLKCTTSSNPTRKVSQRHNRTIHHQTDSHYFVNDTTELSYADHNYNRTIIATTNSQLSTRLIIRKWRAA